VFKAASEDTIGSQSATIALPDTFNVASGDLIVVCVGGEIDVTGVQCGGDDLVEAKTTVGPSYYVSAWYMEGASADGAATCTATYNVSSLWRAILGAHYSGVATSSALLNSSCQDADCDTLISSTTNRSADDVTTTTADTLHVACGLDWDGIATHSAAGDYTLRADGVTPFLYDRNVSATGDFPDGNFGTVSGADAYFSLYLVFDLPQE
jgi:hypothetical protein